MTNAADKTSLRILGYRVEDMGAENGPSFAGKFRWINLADATFGAESSSEDDAWLQACGNYLRSTVNLARW